MRWGDAIIFEKKPHNKFDKNAVSITLLEGSDLGFVPRDETWPFKLNITFGRIKSVGKGSGGFYGNTQIKLKL